MGSTYKYLLLLLLGASFLAASALLLAPSAASDEIDLTGEWEFTIAGDFSAACDLEIEQTGTSISGTFDCADGTSGGFAGTITQEGDGASLDLDLTVVPLVGPTVFADAEGMVPADGNSFTGTWNAPGFGMSGTFDGTRLSGPPPTPSPSPSPSPTPSATIHSIEFTQAIQEWQTIEDLKTDLQGDQSPPVPMIEGKPGTIRVYLSEVMDVTNLKLQASGNVSGTKNVTLLPGCTPEKRRKQEGSCDSVDFDFAGAPPGFWNVSITLKNDDDDVLEQHSFNLKSVAADGIVLKAVSVCDAISVPGIFPTWECAPASAIGPLTSLMRKIAPTDEVRVVQTPHMVRYNAANYADANDWKNQVKRDVDNLYDVWDSLASGLAGTEIYYVGAIRNAAPGVYFGSAVGIPGRGAIVRTSATNATLPHEVGHLMGLEHTKVALPGGNPGCWASSTNSPSWPYGDNKLQSGPGPNGTLEVGFDVATKKALPGDKNFELMGYCHVRWISPFTTLAMLEPAGPLGSPSGGAIPVEGSFWLVSGVIDDSVTFAPLVSLETEGLADAGTGPYRIEVQDGTGSPLFTRFFTPTKASEDLPPGVEEEEGPPSFGELVPEQDGAARIVVISDTGTEIGAIELVGAAPAVTILPIGGGGNGEGVVEFSWSVEDPDSSEHTFWVDYSPDGGQTWVSQGMGLADTGLALDPAMLPGSENAVLRVLASDGVNTGSAVSQPFSVAKKSPEAEILFPNDGDVFGFGDIVWFQGMAFDPDDGTLEDSVSWSSSIDGPLGTGTNLPLTDLSIGEHVITLEVTDSDDNVVTDEITVVVGDGDVDETVLPTPMPTPGPTTTPTPTAIPTSTTTAAPTPAPTPGGEFTQGDADCDGDVDAVDALKTLQYIAALDFTQEPGCPEFGATRIATAAPAGADATFGDVDCDGDVDAVDALQILRFVAGLPVNQGDGCKPIGV